MNTHEPKGFVTVAAAAILLVIALVVVAFIYSAKPQVSTSLNGNSNTNTAVVNVSCKVDNDCATYCGLSSAYQPFCGTTAGAKPGYCACRGLEPQAPQNLNSSQDVNFSNTNRAVNANANVNSSTNTNSTDSIITYADGGQPCNDDDKCIGQCLTSFESKISGTCALYPGEVAQCGSYHFPKGVKTREGSCP